MRLTWVPILPEWLIGAIATAMIVLLLHGSMVLLRKRVPARWVLYLAVLRLVAVGVLVLCLLQPTLLLPRQVSRGPDLIVMVDTSRSMATAVGGGASRLRDTMSRLRGSGLEKSLSEKFTLRWFAFDDDARPLEGAGSSGLEPTGDTTRMAESLATAWSCYRQSRGREAASDVASGRVLLITDGVDHGGRDVVQEAQRLGITVDTLVPRGSGEPREDTMLEIVGVQSARRVLLGSECRFLVSLRQRGYDDSPLKLVLAEDGERVATMDVAFAPGQEERHVTLTYRPRTTGIKAYALHVESVPPAAALDDSVKPYELSCHVVGQRSEVLVLQDTWRWDFKFLRRVVEEDPSFSLTAFLPRGDGTFMHYGEPDRTVSPVGPPRTKAEIDWYDTIVLGDFRPGAWSSALMSGISRAVSEDGKSLVVVAGPNIARMAQSPDMDALLPVEITPESATPTQGPVDVRLTPEAAQSPSFFSAAGGSAAQRWGALPAMDQIYAPLRKRPAATILLEAVSNANAYGNLIVIAEHTVGRGRVAYVGTDTLWKWQMMGAVDEAGNTPYTTFWQQTLRALAPRRVSPGATNLWVQPERTRYDTGQTVHVETVVESERPITASKVESFVTLPDGRSLPLVLLADAAKPGTYRTSFDTTKPGSYRVSAVLTSDGRPVADTVAVITVQESASETGRVAIDHAEMSRLATVTGGRAIDPDQRSTWPDTDGGNVSVTQTRRVSLWAGFWLPVLLCLVLGTDWLLRLIRGYV